MIWATHREEPERSGDFFFTWQYDMRWAALVLRKRGVLAPAGTAGDRVWRLALSCTRFFWTPICPRRNRNDDVQHEEDRSSFSR